MITREGLDDESVDSLYGKLGAKPDG